MKRTLALLLALVMCLALLAGCGQDKKNEEADKPAQSDQKDTDEKPEEKDEPKDETAEPDVKGEVYDTGEFKAVVPEGWAAFAIIDTFSENLDQIDSSCFNIIKDGKSDLDLFTNPYVRFDYYGPDITMMRPSSDWYENVEEVAPFTVGLHTWEGFTGDSGYGRMAILWAEEGDYQYQATVWLVAESETITLENEDVLAILGSVEPSDTAAVVPDEPVADDSGDVSGDDAFYEDTDDSSDIADAQDFSWWDGYWYGWWCIKNGTGIYESASDVAWDAYACISVYDGGDGYISLWDTGTSEYEPLACGYTVFESGITDKGRLVNDYVTFFSEGVWNNGSEASGMDLEYAQWTIDPADSSVSHFENMIEIKGHYADPNNEEDSFDYFFYLRPWGSLWDDVANGDTSDCIYSDMMPLYYYDWYLPVLDLGYDYPPSSFEEGIALLEGSSES